MKQVDILLPFHRIDKFFIELLNNIRTAEGPLNFIFIDDRIDRREDINFYLNMFPKNFKIIQTIGGVGYGKALEIGTKFSDSDFISLLNSDDLIHPKKFNIQLNAIGNSDISITNMSRIDQNGKKVKSLLGDWNVNDYFVESLIFGSYGANATWLTTREWWDKFAFFDNGECLDWRIGLRSLPQSQINFIPNALYYYRKHPLQTTNHRNIPRNKMEIVFIEWTQFLASNNLPLPEYEVFNFVAIPWNKYQIDRIDSILNFINELMPKLNHLNRNQKNLVEALIAKRMLANILNSRNFKTKCLLLIKGRNELLNLLH